MNDVPSGTTSLSTLHVSRSGGGNNIACADIASLQADFISAGSKQSWIIGLETDDNGGRAMMFRADETSPTFYTITASGWEAATGYGACWTYRDATGQDHVSTA